jgi:hypothetical protein
MSARPRLKLVQGEDRTFPFVYTVDGSTPSTQFLGTDTLTGRVWAGGSTPTLFAPTVGWDADNGGYAAAAFTVAIAGTNTTGFTPAGVYRLQALATRSGQSEIILDADLEIASAPGTDTAPTFYTSLDDLLDYADWLTDLQTDRDVMGFTHQRARARSWFDGMIVSRWKWNSTSPTPGTPGYGGYSLYGSYDPFPSKWLRDQLGANLVIVRDEIKEACAKRAIHYVCQRQIGQGDSARDYARLARYFLRSSEELSKTIRVEIDLNGDGYADFTVNLGATDLR